MTRTIALLLALLGPLAAGPLTELERDNLLRHLERTRAIFLRSIAGLGPAQWAFKPAPDRWSIAECAEHITTSESMILSLVRNRILKSPPPAAPPARRATDEGVLAFMTDRSQKAQAPEMLQPKAKYANPEEVKIAFEKARAESADYVRTTGDDLRGRFGPDFPAGVMDGYQYLLMMAAHSERHSMQIEEVKKSPGYPK